MLRIFNIYRICYDFFGSLDDALSFGVWWPVADIVRRCGHVLRTNDCRAL